MHSPGQSLRVALGRLSADDRARLVAHEMDGMPVEALTPTVSSVVLLGSLARRAPSCG